MAQTVVITRSTRLGFGWTTSCKQTESGLKVCKVEKPDYFGTVKTLNEKIRNDRNLQSLGGTCYSSAYFVKVDGEWKEILCGFQYKNVYDLLATKKEAGIDEPGFLTDSVTVELA